MKKNEIERSITEAPMDDVIEMVDEGEWKLLDRKTGKIYTRDEYIQEFYHAKA